MKWTELADRVMITFDKSNENRYKILKFLSEGENDFACYTKCYEKEYSTTISDFSSGVALPDDFMELSSSPTWGGVLLSKHNNEINKINSGGTIVTGIPRFYYIERDTLQFVPKPTASNVLQFLYIATPNNDATETFAYESSDSTMLQKPSIPQAYHIYLIDYAKAMMYEEVGNYELADRLLRRYYSHRDVVRAEHTNRDYGNEFALVSDLSYIDIDI